MNSRKAPRIQRTSKIPINTLEERVLQSMFSEYDRVAIEAEFGTGYSGCRVLRVRPIESGGAAHRPELVKIGPIALINEEWRAYDSLVRTTLPRIAWVTSAPMLAPDSDWGGIRYELVGAGIFEVHSFSQYYPQADTEDILWVLQKRLFPVMSRSWWLANRPDSAFQFQTDYDHLLPVNLMISATEPLPDSLVQVISPFKRSEVEANIGAKVTLQDFLIVELDAEKGQLTLNHPEALEDRPFDSFRIRIEGLSEVDRFREGSVIEPLYGVVTDTRHSMLLDQSRKTLGEYVNLSAKSFKLANGLSIPNPLLSYQDLLSMFHEVNISTIHGDLNLENILIDPETRDVKLIDFASVRKGHNLHDLLRLETGVLTVLMPDTLSKAKLSPPTVINLYQILDQVVCRQDKVSTIQLPHDSLEKPFAVLKAIREEARKCLFYPEDWSEYYAGLALYLLGVLKFKSMDDIANAKTIAFLGAAAAVDLLKPPERAAQGQASVPASSKDVPKEAMSTWLAQKHSRWIWAGVSAIVLIVLAIGAYLIIDRSRGPHSIDYLCRIEEALTIDISNRAPDGENLLDYYEIGNPELFEHINVIEEIFLDGQEHRGITYVWGAPGVGKSLITRNRLGQNFPGDTCLVKIGNLFTVDSDKLNFEVARTAELASLDSSTEFDSLPALVEVNDFDLDSMLAAAGCEQNGQLVPLIIFDDLDEVSKETSEEILRSVDQFMLDVEESEESYIHVFVFGRPEGFAPWFQDPRRHEGVMALLRVFALGGPYVSSMGDLEILAEEEYSFILGSETWQAKKNDGSAGQLIADYARYVANQPILPYSVRSLSIAEMIVGRTSNNPDDTEADLKAFLFEELLLRASNIHGRPLISDDQYLRILEEIATKYNSEEQMDENGFFSVGASETVPVSDVSGQQVGEVLVRDVLDHSGISYLEPASFSSPRYSFYPFWIHSHLVELSNQRLDENHAYRACNS
jgi:hypothetical protein